MFSKSSVVSYTQMVNVNNLCLWTESFGDKTNPAILLIMGSNGQGVMWPVAFCEMLVKKGFFVIRYDHRDTGLSSFVNFQEQPYSLLDMTNDAIAILSHYGIQKAHIVGASMGGLIAQLLGANYPERVLSLTLIVTSPDMRPVFAALKGEPSESLLPGPAERVVTNAKNLTNPPNSREEKIALFIENAHINSGKGFPVEEVFCRAIAEQVVDRAFLANTNHFFAIEHSYELYKDAAKKVPMPTTIIHGDDDPIFPIEHGYALKKAINHAELVIIPGLGHSLANTKLFDILFDLIVNTASKVDACALAASRP